MPKLVARNLELEEFEQLRTVGPNAGLLRKPVESAGGVQGAAGSAPDAIEAARTFKWVKMLGAWRRYTDNKTSKVKRRVRKGIPDAMRRSAWNAMTNMPLYTARFPDLYEQLASGTHDGAHTTAALRSVDLDLYRTFPEHACFATGTPQGEMGVTSLRRVLHAYAAFDDELGYCQSLNFLAGTLLMYLPEREAFWTLVFLMQREGSALRGLYLEGMAETQIYLKVLDGLILLHLPKLAAHFASEGVVAPMYATAWFMTVFTRDFPVGLTARVLDCFLGDPHGTKILHRVALALLQRAQAELLQADLGDCLVLVRELPKTHCNNPRVLMEEAFKFNLKRVEITNAADTGEDALNKAQAMARATEE